MDYNKIYIIPPIPQEVVDAVNNETLAVFIGAGVSRLVGCWGWDKLARELVEKCHATKKPNGESCLNFKQKEVVSQYNDNVKTITICYERLKDNEKENIFDRVLRKALSGDKKLLGKRNIYDVLIRLHGIFITTNADEHFDRKFEPSRIVYEKKEINPLNVERNKLYHIHGSIKDKSSLVFRVHDYLERYNPEQNLSFTDFLKKIFQEYVVIFVGYGLAEFELLDYVITKFDAGDKVQRRKFMLKHYWKGEDNILELDQYYYNKMGITILGYEIDEIGYIQLYNVIDEWNKEIGRRSTYLYRSYNEIDKIVDSYGS